MQNRLDGGKIWKKEEGMGEGRNFMERLFIYFLAAANILVGFLILSGSADRFGSETYRSFLDREEKSMEKSARRN